MMWRKLRTWAEVFLILAATGYVCYFEGYRRGCADTMNVVEDKADKLVHKIEQRLFGG